jgi:DNA-binding CsgD family transcriptional regulator
MRNRCRERLDLLGDSAAESEVLRREAIEILRSAIGFDRWCTLLLDPDTLVISQGIGHIDWYAELPRLNLSEASFGDVTSHAVLARSRSHVGILSAATGGQLARSARWRDVLGAHGVGDELGCVAADELGCWGDFRLFRNSDDPVFSADDAQLMRDASALLARGLRRSAASPMAAADTTPDAMGVQLLADDLSPCGATPAARDWFGALNPAGIPFPHGIPGLVWNVVGRLVALESGEDSARPPRVRARTGCGRWAVVEAARVEGGAAGIAVTIRAAGAEDVLGLVARASGLTPRERELVALLLEGLDTRELAQRLFISRHTVQDHLKSIFAKIGVSSRRELLSSVFAQAA